MKRIFLLCFMAFCMSAIGFAQQTTITGTVNDVGDLPLPGVTVIIKGTSNGTIS